MPATLSPILDAATDHVLGAPGAPLTLVMFGDFQCPYCRAAQGVVARVRARLGDEVLFAFRHLPITEKHPLAQAAAEASEEGATQGDFWGLHDALYAGQPRLTSAAAVVAIAREAGLDAAAVERALADGRHAGRVARDVASARASGATGTPTFFVNGRRHDDVYDAGSLVAALRA